MNKPLMYKGFYEFVTDNSINIKSLEIITVSRLFYVYEKCGCLFNLLFDGRILILYGFVDIYRIQKRNNNKKNRRNI